jgi:hypothetical protein
LKKLWQHDGLKSIINTPAFVYDFSQQSFNDAICFLEQAKKQDFFKKPFKYWKYCVWSIVASSAFFESYTIAHIRRITHSVDQSIFDAYTEPEKMMGFPQNIEFIDTTFDSKINDPLDKDWQNIEYIRDIRNKIMHHKKLDIMNDFTVDNAQMGINVSRSLVKKLHSIEGTNYKKFAYWIDATKCIDYDKVNWRKLMENP